MVLMFFLLLNHFHSSWLDFYSLKERHKKKFLMRPWDSQLGISQVLMRVIILTEEGPNFGVMCPHYQAGRVQKVIDNVHFYHKNNHNWQVRGNIISG